MSTEVAFEYAIGTLRGNERKGFAIKCLNDQDLQKRVHFWEEQLMEFDSDHKLLPPKSSTWSTIKHQINTPTRARRVFRKTTCWFASYVFVSLIVFVVGSMYLTLPRLPQSQYIAILSDDNNQAALTALTVSDEQRMWLQWETMEIPPDTSGQLWAVSRRDGTARSIAIFNDKSTSSIALDKARWRLITDAEYLLLTEEEHGGSPIDEPSDTVLAKGVCVQYKNDKRG